MNVQTEKSPILTFRGSGNVYPPLTPNDTNSDDVVAIIVDHRKNRNHKSSRLSKIFSSLLVVINVVTAVMMLVALPIFSGTMEAVGGDLFVVMLVAAMWFPLLFLIMTGIIKATIKPTLTLRPGASWKVVFLLGLTYTLSAVFSVFSSPPDRTPAYLQGILGTMTIPNTVLFRYLILRKGISLRRLVCTGIILIGLFITVEPQIWGLKGSGDSGTTKKSAVHTIIWPLLFCMSFIPSSISNVICEKELQTDESESLSLVMWTQVFQLLTILPLFWLDFIPFFGMADNFSDFSTRFRTGFLCCFSLAEQCKNLIGKLWLFVGAYCLSNMFSFLLIEYTEGAVYSAVVSSLTTPLATLFWTLFKFEPKDNHFSWFPDFNITTWFTMAGLVIIMPTVMMYTYFSNQDALDKQKQDKIPASETSSVCTDMET